MGKAIESRQKARRPHLFFVAAGVALSLGREGRADSIYWQGVVGNWFNANNWFDNNNGLDQVPGGSDSASIENGGTAQISSGSADDSELVVDFGSAFVLTGNGSLSTGQGSGEYVGNSGTGIFNQSGGTNGCVSLALGYYTDATGTYVLSGTGSLAASGNENVGAAGGLGIFNQSGGTNISGTVSLGGGGEGIIYQSGGTSASSSETLGAGGGGGTVYQSGGVNTINGGLGILSGTYSLSSTGSLSAINEVVGNGTLSQTGGTNTSVQEQVGGIYNQTGGSSSTGNLSISLNSGSVGTFNLTGGTATASNVYVGGSFMGPGGTGFLTVSNAGQLSVPGNFRVWSSGQANLDVPDTTVGNLSIVGKGIVNLNGALQINFDAPANDPISTIVGYLQTGYNGGTWTGTLGIISTNAAAGGRVTTLGYLDGNIDTTDSAVVGPNQILIKYTLVGDANLDGVVNFTDFAIVLKNFGQAGTDWAQGNFEYAANSPSIQGTNFNDFADVLKNFLQPLPGGGGAETIGDTIQPLATTIQVAATSLPEPTSLSLLAAGAVGLLRRTRKTKTKT